MKHRPQALEWQTKARVYGKERDNCGWTGRPTKPGRSETSFNTPVIERDRSNSVQIIHRDLGLKCFPLPTCLLAIIVSFFSYMYISQSSVATPLRCDGMFTNHVIANFPANVSVKKIENRLIFGKDMDNTMWDAFDTQCTYIILNIFFLSKSVSERQYSYNNEEKSVVRWIIKFAIFNLHFMAHYWNEKRCRRRMPTWYAAVWLAAIECVKRLHSTRHDYAKCSLRHFFDFCDVRWPWRFTFFEPQISTLATPALRNIHTNFGSSNLSVFSKSCRVYNITISRDRGRIFTCSGHITSAKKTVVYSVVSSGVTTRGEVRQLPQGAKRQGR